MSHVEIALLPLLRVQQWGMGHRHMCRREWQQMGMEYRIEGRQPLRKLTPHDSYEILTYRPSLPVAREHKEEECMSYRSRVLGLP